MKKQNFGLMSENCVLGAEVDCTRKYWWVHGIACNWKVSLEPEEFHDHRCDPDSRFKKISFVSCCGSFQTGLDQDMFRFWRFVRSCTWPG